MSLNHRQLRLLHRIESGLFRSDPQLAAMLVMFARLAAGEDLPVWEQEATRPGCIRQSAALIVKAVTVLVAAIAVLLNMVRAETRSRGLSRPPAAPAPDAGG
jgi:hypothetical protein